MKEYLEHMRFPVRGSNDFWHVVKTDWAKVYDVYYAEVEMYPDVVSIYHYLMDLNQFSEEELGRYVANWGYSDYPAFVDYLENKTMVKNNELRLCTCIIEQDNSFQPAVVFQGDMFGVSDFMFERIGPESEEDILFAASVENPEIPQC